METSVKALTLCIFIAKSTACMWPSSDVLFILDGTMSLDHFQFQKEISFVTQTLSKMKISEDGVHLSLAQFTPRGRQEFGLDKVKTNAEARQAVEQVQFSPCDVLSDPTRCNPRASINSLAGQALQTENRKWVPDVVVVISTSKYRIPEKLPQETLLSPKSPLHIFYIIVGGTSPDEKRFEPSATSINLNAVDFSALERLVLPLCGPKVAAFGSTCWLVTCILLAILLLTILVLGYAVYAYWKEGRTLGVKLKEMEKALRTQNEFFTAKLHSQMEEHIKASEKHAEELRKQNESMQAQQVEFQRQQQQHLLSAPPSSVVQAQPIIVPYLASNSAVSQQPANPDLAVRDSPFILQGSAPGRFVEHSFNNRSDAGTQSVLGGDLNSGENDGRLTKSDEELKLRLDKLEESLGNARKPNEQGGPEHTDLSKSSDEQLAWQNSIPHTISEEDSSDAATDDSGYVARGGHLPANHPARQLPPIDLLFLVDSSSSIGITNFEAIKTNIINVLEDVDIGPGRSRVAVVQYALQPSVVFGFDKYYSLKSVQRGVERMSYTGGATMLAKALSFAAGLLYREQNMRDMKKRKHKLMPTPRHDRLQVLCLVSDGASDDNIDKSTAYLHEKLQIKIFAMVTRHFNKSRLLSVTRYDGSIFVMDQKESISIWLWRQQKMWAENYSAYIEREKSMPLSVKHSPKKSARTEETQPKSPKSL
uniref:VWFA domain-containing protein n=1 Tax=Haemonchus contortus TaxID=6289 RepID=A0A7I5ECD6_HAECO